MEQSFGTVVSKKSKSTKFLMVKHKSGHWGFPKGHIEDNENPKNTAKREVLEETGYNIELLEGFYETIEYKLPNGILKNVGYFIGDIQSGEILFNPNEIETVAWLSYDEIKNIDVFGDLIIVLNKAINFLSKQQNGR